MPDYADLPPVSSRARHWWKRHSHTVVIGLLGVILVATVGAFFALRRAKEKPIYDKEKPIYDMVLKGPAPVTSVAFSAEGKRIVSARGDLLHSGQTGEVQVWDAQTGQEMLSFKGHAGGVWSVAFSPDGQRIVSGSGASNTPGVVQVWDAQTGQELLTLKGHHNMVWSVAFSGDGKRIVSGSFDRTVKVWDAHTGKLIFTLQGHTGDVHSVAFSPDSKRIASGDWDYTVKVWDAHTGQEALSLQGHTDWVNSVAFSPDGKRLASASGGYDQKQEEFWGEVQLWDAQTGKEQLTLKGHAFYVRSVAFSADGKRIVSGSEGLWNISPGEVKVWDAHTGQEQRTLKGHTYQVWSVAFSPDGTRIVSGGWGCDLMTNRYWGELKVWDAGMSEPPAEQHGK